MSISPIATQASPFQKVLDAMEKGGTIDGIARRAGVSVAFAQSVVEHFQRLGHVGNASSLCSSGLGLCSPHARDGNTAPEAIIACASCPFAR